MTIETILEITMSRSMMAELGLIVDTHEDAIDVVAIAVDETEKAISSGAPEAVMTDVNTTAIVRHS